MPAPDNMTHPNAPVLPTAAAVFVLIVAGCDAPTPPTSGATALSPSGQTTQTDSMSTALDVVRAFILEQTEEGAPYLIEGSATEFERLEKQIIHRNGELVCRAVFRSQGSAFHVDYILERELEAYAITRIMLKTIDGEPAERVLYDRTTLVQ